MTSVSRKNDVRPGDTYHLAQGGLLISAVDLARVSSILLNNGKYNGRQYLSEASLREMLTVHPVKTDGNFEQCLGIRRSTELIDGRNMYYHNGTYYGVLALLAIDPDDRSGVIVITSGAYSGRRSNTLFDVCDDVMKYCYQEII